MKESDFQQQVIDLAHLSRWDKVAHFRTVRVQRSNGGVYYCTPVAADGVGFPDLLMVRGERLVIAELKVGTNRLSEDQAEWMFALSGAKSVETYVWYPKDWDDIEEKLRR